MGRTTVLVAAILAAGCSNSLSDVRAEYAEGGGTTRIYEAPAAKVYAATRDVLREESVEGLEEHPDDGAMLGHRSPSVIPWRYGAYVGVWIRPSGADHAKVTVVTKRESGGVVFTGLREGTFLDELGVVLAAPPPPPASTPAASPAASVAAK